MPLDMAKSILVTGGAGYIGSHTVLQLLLGGFRAIVVDNLDNSSEEAIRRVGEIAGESRENLTFYKVYVPFLDSEMERWMIEFKCFLVV